MPREVRPTTSSYFDKEGSIIDGTIQSSGSNIRHNVIVEKDIASKSDLKLGETATVKKSVGKYVQQIKLDDGIYELDYQKDDLPKAFTQGNVVNNITTENHTIEFDGSTDQIKISDSSDYLRVILGKIGTAGDYGLKINNISGSELFGLYGTTANIAGWTVNADHLLSADAFTNINSAGHIVLGNPATTDVLKLSGVADDDYRIWVGNINDTLAPFKVHKDGSFYSVQGTIGGWSIGETILKSDTGYGSRIQLDRGENRVSIFDSTNTEKVAMGYLDELLKSNGYETGSDATTYSGTTMTDSGRSEENENAWQTNELTGLYIKPTGLNRVVIVSNTFNVVTVADGWGGQATPSENDGYRIEFGSQDYGFWVLPGDRLQIDGDVNYEGGDWLIQHDASLRIFNGAGKEIIRLGTDTADKGLFLYDASGSASENITAKLITDTLRLGKEADLHVDVIAGSMLFKVGQNPEEHKTVMELKYDDEEDEGNKSLITLGSNGINDFPNTKIGGDNITLSSTANTKLVLLGNSISLYSGIEDQYSMLSAGNLQFVSGDFINNYTFIQFIPSSLLEFGTPFIFAQNEGYSDYPAGKTYEVLYTPRLVMTYDDTYNTVDQGYGFSSSGPYGGSVPTAQGFTPHLRFYNDDLDPTVGLIAATIDQPLCGNGVSSYQYTFWGDGYYFDPNSNPNLRIGDHEFKMSRNDGAGDTPPETHTSTEYVSGFIESAWDITDVSTSTVERVRFRIKFYSTGSISEGNALSIVGVVKVGERDSSNDYWTDGRFAHIFLPEVILHGSESNDSPTEVVDYDYSFGETGIYGGVNGGLYLGGACANSLTGEMLFELHMTHSHVVGYYNNNIPSTSKMDLLSLEYESTLTSDEITGKGLADAILLSK